MKITTFLAVTTAAITWSWPVSAQFAKPEDAIKYRQSAMFIMSQHFGRLGAMANGRVPFDAKTAQDNAEIVAEISKLPWPAYAPGTDKALPTKVKPEIWTEQAKFKESSEKLQSEAIKLVTAAKTGNVDNLKTAFGATASVCKSCHDAFRNQ